MAKHLGSGYGAGYKADTPCWHCGARDSRDAAHARGCPGLAEFDLDRDELLALALAVEAGWERSNAGAHKSEQRAKKSAA